MARKLWAGSWRAVGGAARAVGGAMTSPSPLAEVPPHCGAAGRLASTWVQGPGAWCPLGQVFPDPKVNRRPWGRTGPRL